MFADQSGFYLLPLVLRTYAPVGQTPVIKEYLSHDHFGDERDHAPGQTLHDSTGTIL